MKLRVGFALALMAALGGCGELVHQKNASEEVIRAKEYRHAGPASITVVTMVNNRSGNGAHSALLINGSQRVMFDPAGSFQNDVVPERDDVLFGMSPRVLAAYKSAHARSTYHVVSQTIEVTPEQAEIALRAALRHGPTARSFCTQSTTGVLQQVPGFADIKSTFFPSQLMRQIAKRPGVVTDKYFEDDAGGIIEGVAKVQL